MAKMRDYVYGSSKFEKEINDAVSNAGTPEGTSVKSTGATSGKVLTANGSGGASWETASGGTPEGTSVKSTGVTSGKVLTANGSGGASWASEVKVYQHNIIIQAKDANNESYYYEYSVYNTSPTPLVNTYNPTYMDVINLLCDTITSEQGLTPAYFNEGHWNYFIAERGESNSLMAFYYDIQTQNYTTEEAITSVSVLYDYVREM